MRILVTVASRHQGTWEIGEVIARRLRERGHEVDQHAPEDVTSIVDHVQIGRASCRERVYDDV